MSLNTPIFTIAKDLNVESNRILLACKKLGINAKGATKRLNKEELEKIKSYFETGKNVSDEIVNLNKNKIKSKIFVKSKYDTNKKKISGVHSISSVSGYGIEPLIKTISSKLKKKPISGPVFSRERHTESLKKSLVLLKRLNLNEIDIAAENVRRSIMYIDGINQKFDIEKILDIIFSDFCIGK